MSEVKVRDPATKAPLDLEIKKIKVQDDDAGVKPSNHPGILPIHPFRLSVNGASGSGKTNLILNLLTRKKFYKGYFQVVKVFSPSFWQDKAYTALVEKKVLVPERDVVTDMDKAPAIIERWLAIQKGVIESVGKAKSPRMLFLFDDFIDSPLRTSPVLEAVAIRGRHYNLSSIYACQSYNKLPRPIRLQMSNIIVFKPSRDEIEVLAKEQNTDLPEAAFMKLVTECTSAKYSFMHINRQCEDSSERFRCGFTTIKKLQ